MTDIQPSPYALLYQYESDTTSLGLTHGLTVYATEDGGYTYRVHTRRYDGIRVADSWSSDHVHLAVDTKEEARAEAQARYRTWLGTLGYTPEEIR